jgi:hypothetical protein
MDGRIVGSGFAWGSFPSVRMTISQTGFAGERVFESGIMSGQESATLSVNVERGRPG